MWQNLENTLYMLVEMDAQILDERENVFFGRRDVKLLISHPQAPTPSKQEITKHLAEQRNVDESQVIIDYVFSKKGICESLVKLKILNEKPKVQEKSQAVQPTPAEKKEEEKDETQASEDE